MNVRRITRDRHGVIIENVTIDVDRIGYGLADLIHAVGRQAVILVGDDGTTAEYTREES